MAVHNGAATAPSAATSIIRQTYTDWECIIVDDASTDNSNAVLQELARSDNRIKILQNQENLGLAASLNIGWRLARGEFIARTDDDDISFPERLSDQVSFLNQNPNIAVLGSGAELIDEDGKLLGIALRPEHHEELVCNIYKECPFIHPSVIMRRSFLAAMGGYDERLRRAQDYDLWLRSYRFFRFHNLQKPLIRYRVRRRQSLTAIYYGAYVMMRSLQRDNKILSHGFCLIRYIVASMLTKAGLYNSRLRPINRFSSYSNLLL